jgi:hypothetical protein
MNVSTATGTAFSYTVAQFGASCSIRTIKEPVPSKQIFYVFSEN